MMHDEGWEKGCEKGGKKGVIFNELSEKGVILGVL